MLAQAVASYLAVRRACGFHLKTEGNLLRSFAAFSDTKRKHQFALKPLSSGLDGLNRFISALAVLAT